MSAPPQRARIFRLPALTYLTVLFLLFCVTPLAVASGADRLSRPTISPRIALLAVPVLIAVFIARWATVVDERGITVRAAFGKRLLPWDEVRGLSVEGRSVYVVTADGSLRLPCIHVAQLGALARASDGRLPEIADPKPHYPPQRRRR